MQLPTARYPGLTARVTAAAGALACLGLLAWSLVQGAALMQANAGDYHASAFTALGELKAPPEELWVKADEAYRSAQALAPHATDLATALGRMREWQVIEQPPGAPEAAAARRAALGHHLRALQGRPSSPYAWASVAMVRARLGDTGPAFVQAVDRALALGPWELAVQQRMAVLGSVQAAQLPAETLERVERARAWSAQEEAFTEQGLALLESGEAAAILAELPP